MPICFNTCVIMDVCTHAQVCVGGCVCVLRSLLYQICLKFGDTAFQLRLHHSITAALTPASTLSSAYAFTHRHARTHTRTHATAIQSNPWLRVEIISWSVTRRTMTVKCSLLEAHKTYTVAPLRRPGWCAPPLHQSAQAALHADFTPPPPCAYIVPIFTASL